MMAITAAKVIASCISFLCDLLGYGKNSKLIDCSDVNECATNNGGCHSRRKCTNTVGGRTCGDCPSGYVNDGDTGCKGQCRAVNENDVHVNMID